MSKYTKVAIIMLFVGGLCVSFVLGRLSKGPNIQRELSIISASDIQEILEEDVEIQIRASSRGSKYYFPWCQSTFSESNTIYFASEEEAKEAGYEKAENCISDEE